MPLTQSGQRKSSTPSTCVGGAAGETCCKAPAALISVLVGCEYSGTVRDAFLARGFDAWSNDILPADHNPDRHIQGDVRNAIISRRWDLVILHPECTKMAVCGNKHYGTGKPKHHERLKSIEWTCETVWWALKQANYVAAENPASVIFPELRKRWDADVQYIQPWEFGHPEQKKTGLALFGLPRLKPTNNVHEEMMQLPRKERERIFFMSPSADRGHERSRFFPGIAEAMAHQWGDFLLSHNIPCKLTEADSAVPSSFHEVCND